ncbi:hypothetical protein H5A40_17180 [Pectobacterium brasiliense]|uniref:hypothetical protein n=1 Tax=Pectobacterium brasiliense TaxID=180957 RepID=UPI001968C161|nr:hypothetical protein [Pectobacterium brasiliense]QSD34785.1 hypothetical protein H5A40_17180 [Pectobacterium brasiliense]
MAGETLLPNATEDRQALARVADAVRSVCFIPVETVRLVEHGKRIIGYKMAQHDIADYHNDCTGQERRQKQAIQHAKNIRDARICKKLFARLGIDLPPEIAALARTADGDEPICEIDDDGVIR